MSDDLTDVSEFIECENERRGCGDDDGDGDDVEAFVNRENQHRGRGDDVGADDG